jgi:hypothetical protein
MLCARCQNFDIQVFQRDSYPYRGIPLLATIRSAKVCSFCSLLLQHLIETQPDINLSGAIFACKELRSVDWLSSEPLKWLLYWADTQVTLPRWVNFGVSRTSEQPIDEDDGLNIASLNFFIGSLDDASERACELTFHAGADPGEFRSHMNPYKTLITYILLPRHPGINISRHHWQIDIGKTVVGALIRYHPIMAQRLCP